MNTTRTRPAWIKWLLLAALVLAIALGIARAMNKRKAQSEAASAAAAAMQKTAVYELAAQDVVSVQALELAQTVGVSGSLKALQTAAIKARVAGELQGLSKREGEDARARWWRASPAPKRRRVCARPSSRRNRRRRKWPLPAAHKTTTSRW
jgi:hypothetical protein